MDLMNLETLLNEFYHTTSNFRKKEIERILREYQENESSIQIILQNLPISLNNQYLFFFSVSTLEVDATTFINDYQLTWMFFRY